MKTLSQIETDNINAYNREYRLAVARLNELEAQLGLVVSRIEDVAQDWRWLRARIKHLEKAARSRIDPNDPGIQQQPILWGEFKNRAPRPPFPGVK